MALKLSLVILSIFYIFSLIEAGEVSFTTCAPSTSTFTVSHITITDANSLDQCDLQNCVIISGHDYDVTFDGCATATANLTSIPFRISADISLEGIEPFIKDLLLKEGDFCNYFSSSSPVQSCPVTTPACAKFAIQIHAPIVAVPVPVGTDPTPGTPSRVNGYAWYNTRGTYANADICLDVPFRYKLLP